MTTPPSASMPPFHLAFPVHDLAAARTFYGGMLGCEEGRSSPHWIDFNLYGHQIVAHLSPEDCSPVHAATVDADAVPVRHFGLVLGWQDWEALGEKLAQHDADFIIRPKVRFVGEVGEQGTFFVRDPSGNALEFKAFRDLSQLFAR